MKNVYLDGHNTSTYDIYELAYGNSLGLTSDTSRKRIQESRKMLEKIVCHETIYGVTTGYGEMVYVLVDNSKETELQTNLIRSHAAGVGNCFAKEESRSMLAAR